MKRFITLVILFSLLTSVALSAQAQADNPSGNLTDGCVDSYDANVDYFPDKVSVEYAHNFSVEYFNNYKLVSMLPWTGADSQMQYLLVQCGTPIPEGYDRRTDLRSADAPLRQHVDEHPAPLERAKLARPAGWR